MELGPQISSLGSFNLSCLISNVTIQLQTAHTLLSLCPVMPSAPELQVLRISRRVLGLANRMGYHPLGSSSQVHGGWCLVWKTNRGGGTLVSQVTVPVQWGIYYLTRATHLLCSFKHIQLVLVVCPL